MKSYSNAVIFKCSEDFPHGISCVVYRSARLGECFNKIVVNVLFFFCKLQLVYSIL